MKKRLDALNRIGRLEAKMRDLGQWRLSALEREQAGLSDDLRAAFDAFESDALAFGPQAGLVARRARALQRRLDALDREAERARHKTQTHGIRAKLAEEAAEAAGKAYRDQKERKELVETIERALRRRGTSQG
jgi:hypothetical protein